VACTSTCTTIFAKKLSLLWSSVPPELFVFILELEGLKRSEMFLREAGPGGPGIILEALTELAKQRLDQVEEDELDPEAKR
jgi:hypothetical protein